MLELEQKQELRCPECNAVFKNRAGLNGHRQFKHGIRPTAQLPLEQHDRLVSESRLEQVLEQRWELPNQAIAALTERLDQVDKRLSAAIKGLRLLDQQLSAIVNELPGIRGDILVCQGRLNKLETGSVTKSK